MTCSCFVIAGQGIDHVGRNYYDRWVDKWPLAQDRWWNPKCFRVEREMALPRTMWNRDIWWWSYSWNPWWVPFRSHGRCFRTWQVCSNSSTRQQTTKQILCLDQQIFIARVLLVNGWQSAPCGVWHEPPRLSGEFGYTQKPAAGVPVEGCTYVQTWLMQHSYEINFSIKDFTRGLGHTFVMKYPQPIAFEGTHCPPTFSYEQPWDEAMLVNVIKKPKTNKTLGLVPTGILWSSLFFALEGVYCPWPGQSPLNCGCCSSASGYRKHVPYLLVGCESPRKSFVQLPWNCYSSLTTFGSCDVADRRKLQNRRDFCISEKAKAKNIFFIHAMGGDESNPQSEPLSIWRFATGKLGTAWLILRASGPRCGASCRRNGTEGILWHMSFILCLPLALSALSRGLEEFSFDCDRSDQLYLNQIEDSVFHCTRSER